MRFNCLLCQDKCYQPPNPNGQKENTCWRYHMGESGGYVVVWYGNTQLGEKRKYHSAVFDDFSEALDYYDTTAHGWPTGGKGPKAKNGIGNSRIFFQKSWVTPVWASSVGFQPPPHWWMKMIDLAIQSQVESR